MAPPRRKANQRWLAQYPDLYIRDRDGSFYVRHPVTRKQGSLQTNDRNVAIRRWAMLQQMWEQERKDFDAKRMADNLSMVDPVDEASPITLTEYLHYWRTKLIGHEVLNGKIRWGKCHVFSQRGRNRGRPIATGTRADYAADAQQMESNENSDFLLSYPQLLRRIRRL